MAADAIAVNAGPRFGRALALCSLFATVLLTPVSLMSLVSPVPPVASSDIIVKSYVEPLGMRECTNGPAFWCENITIAAGCGALRHCIKTVWEVQKYPEDHDDVCTICKNMVKEARDTLTSNATLDELQQVFYGSCKLLPLKIIRKQCKNLADDFIPELVDTLASEMDPNVVCTVAGLCNNYYIDELLLEKIQRKIHLEEMINDKHACEQCAIVMAKGEKLVMPMTKDEMLNKILMMCGELSSFSDACSTIVLTYNNEIYHALKNGFTKRNVCILSGMCSVVFHRHGDGYEQDKDSVIGVEISNAGERGRIQKVSDELTCEFCEALVKHLKLVLVANTTEEQFLEVLEGICEQTGSFSDECSAMVKENYSRFYQFLTSELKGKVLCTLVGICPKSPNSNQNLDYIVPMYPLLPIGLTRKLENMQSNEDGQFNAKNKLHNQKPTLVIVDEQPPKVQDIELIKKSPTIDLIYEEMHVVVNSVDMPTDNTVCFLCQSILNYIQQTVTDPSSEEEVRNALEKSCAVVPSSFKQQCIQFVDQYSDAFISLLAQEVDPSIICPELHACPRLDVSLTSVKNNEGSNNCELCVIFMSTLESEISNKDTEKEIKKKLEKLCTKLPQTWKAKCTDFVSNQFESIIDMLIAEVQPKEICVLLDVCQPKSASKSVGGDTETNMIASSDKVSVIFPGYDLGKLLANNYKMLEEPKIPTPFCLVCTVVMKYLHGAIKDKSSQEEIERALDTVCSILPYTQEEECQNFIDSNYQNIIKIIQVGTDPGVACMALMVCEEPKPFVIKVKDGLAKKHNNNMDNTNERLIQSQSTDLDVSDECIACEVFVKVFDERLSNDSAKIDEIDLNELCLEVDVQYKDQAKPNILNLLDYSCKERSIRDYWMNNWFIRELIKKTWSHCSEHCVNKFQFHPKCTICKDVIKDIKNKIKVSPIEQEITYRLESLCDPLPNKDKCVDFVERNTEKFLNTLIDDVSEESICQEIGYC